MWQVDGDREKKWKRRGVLAQPEGSVGQPSGWEQILRYTSMGWAFELLSSCPAYGRRGRDRDEDRDRHDT